MNKETLHVPQRLDGETVDEYRYRQRLSKAAAKLGRVRLVGADQTKRLRRQAAEQVGARQVKKQVKAYKRFLRAQEAAK